ncbi:Riboflavin synthase alpha chain [Lecanora helva]
MSSTRMPANGRVGESAGAAVARPRHVEHSWALARDQVRMELNGFKILRSRSQVRLDLGEILPKEPRNIRSEDFRHHCQIGMMKLLLFQYSALAMFTGLVETIGTVAKLEKQDDSSLGGGGTSLTIAESAEILDDAHLGDSISINGTCLTVTSFTPAEFKVGVSPETLRRTNLGDLVKGSKVNLERAVSATTRMGGHFVQGHVDTIATILSVKPDGNALVFRLQPREKDVLRYVVEKGYVTLDGASLTITGVDDKEEWWEVMLIVYTQERVVLAGKKAGDAVNVEVDMVGKYVEKSVHGYFDGLEKEEGKGSGGILETMIGRILAKMKDAPQ